MGRQPGAPPRGPGAPGAQVLHRLWPEAGGAAVWHGLSCPLSSSQGDRGFDGLAGLPGEKGHRVSVSSLGAAGGGAVGRLFWAALGFLGGWALDSKVVVGEPHEAGAVDLDAGMTSLGMEGQPKESRFRTRS